MSVYQLRGFDEPKGQFRQDVLNAINILFERGHLDRDVHYAFERGPNRKWGIAFWKGDRFHPLGGIAWVDCLDVIVGAGPLPVVRGVSE